jgi:site-specific recombinase XerD
MSEMTTTQADLASSDLLADFGAYLRLHVADGDASAHTLRSYYSNARAFADWCDDSDVKPGAATEDDLLHYRRWLTTFYSRGTVGVKLAAVRRLYEAAVWRGLRADNPAAGLKAPKDRTARAERVKYLPLEGLRRLLAAPEGDGLAARRDRAILALMGRHGLRVAEVAALDVVDVDLEQGTVHVLGKGRKARTVQLVESTKAALVAWLAVRVPRDTSTQPALFVSLDRNAHGSRLSTNGLRYIVDGYLERLGLKADGVSCHSLRHSAATWARAGGAKIDAIADMLGHASTDTTRVYAKIVDKMTENPARYLEAMLGGG